MTRVKPQLSVHAMTLSPEEPVSWRPTFDLVQAADRAGVDRACLTGEHVVFGEDLGAYERPELGGRGSKQATGSDGHYLDPVVVASMIFATTKQIRVATNIMLAALRRPIVLAKTGATLDVLSGGRMDIAVGVGWQREEYEAAGLVFEKRGRLLDHTLEVCQLLWREERATYSSPELSFENIHMQPKPKTPGGTPIWVSGNVKPPAMRRLAAFGVGWVPWGSGQNNDALIEEIPQMREAVAKLGRDPLEIQVAGNLPVVRDSSGAPQVGPTMDGVPALVAAGVTDFRAALPVPPGVEAGEAYLREWVQAFRAATS